MSLFKEKLELKVEEAEFKAQKALSGFAAWQKWVIIICLIGAIPAYFVAKATAAWHYEKIYQKFLIRAHPSFSDPKELTIDRIDVASLGTNEFSVAVQIVNRNLDLSAKNIGYEIKFLAPDGRESAPAMAGRLFILPDSRKFLVVPKITSQAGIASVDFTLSEKVAWQKKPNLPDVKLVTTVPKGQDQFSPFGYVLEGSVKNDSAYNIRETKLIFILYGTGGKVIGASQRSEFDLKPLEKRDYKQIWTGVSGKNVVKAEVHAETNILDKDNLSSPDFPSGGGAGDLER